MLSKQCGQCQSVEGNTNKGFLSAGIKQLDLNPQRCRAWSVSQHLLCLNELWLKIAQEKLLFFSKYACCSLSSHHMHAGLNMSLER